MSLCSLPEQRLPMVLMTGALRMGAMIQAVTGTLREDFRLPTVTVGL